MQELILQTTWFRNVKQAWIKLDKEKQINQQCKMHISSIVWASHIQLQCKYNTTHSKTFRDKGLLCEGNSVITRARLTHIRHYIRRKPVVPLWLVGLNTLHSAVPFPNKSQQFGAFNLRMMTYWNQLWKGQGKTASATQTGWDWFASLVSSGVLVKVSQLPRTSHERDPEIPRRFLHRKHGTKSASDDRRAQWETHLASAEDFFSSLP